MNEANVDITCCSHAQFTTILYDDKVKQWGTTWRIHWKFM